MCYSSKNIFRSNIYDFFFLTSPTFHPHVVLISRDYAPSFSEQKMEIVRDIIDNVLTLKLYFPRWTVNTRPRHGVPHLDSRLAIITIKKMRYNGYFWPFVNWENSWCNIQSFDNVNRLRAFIIIYAICNETRWSTCRVVVVYLFSSKAATSEKWNLLRVKSKKKKKKKNQCSRVRTIS